MPGTYTNPNPNSPNTGDALTSLPIRQNFQALQSQMNNADGAALQTKTVPETALADAINPRLARTEAGTNYVVSGLNPSVPGSGFIVTIPAGIAYVNGARVVYGGGTVTVSASQDTYLDITTTGAIVQVPVANNATTGMTLTANSVRFARVGTNGTNVTSIAQTGIDFIGNQIYNRSPYYRVRYTASGTFSGFSSTTHSNATGSVFIINLPAPCRIICRVNGVVNSNTSGVGFDYFLLVDAVTVGGLGATSSYFYATGQNVPVHQVFDSGVLAVGSHTLSVQVASEGAGTFGGTLGYDYDVVVV